MANSGKCQYSHDCKHARTHYNSRVNGNALYIEMLYGANIFYNAIQIINVKINHGKNSISSFWKDLILTIFAGEKKISMLLVINIKV